jgi:hypothetical protein
VPRQISFLLHVVIPSDWDSITVIGVSWHIEPPVILKSPETPPETSLVYLMISLPHRDDADLDMHWSFDPLGKKRLDVSLLQCLGISSTDEVRRTRKTAQMWLYKDDYKPLDALHQCFGIDPESDEAAHHLGFPLVEFYDLDLEDEEGKRRFSFVPLS